MGEFKCVNEEDFGRIITATQMKHCELDAVPTIRVKGILDEILPIMTHIVNRSLIMGQLLLNWKTAIVKSLLKKSGLDLIAKNNRVVIYLSFIPR